MRNTQLGWEVEILKPALKTLKKCDPTTRQRIKTAIVRLASNFPNCNILKIVGTDMHRLRIGRWRVIYSKNSDQSTIEINQIFRRDKGYNRT